MAILNKQDITIALGRLGELAQSHDLNIELLLLGGSLMVLEFGTRDSTRDVDVVILQPTEIAGVRALVKIIADERSWAEDWLNDAAKGFMVGITQGPIIFSGPGITVRRPAIKQLLAMKLCAWRDDIDIADARRLLQELTGSRDDIWQKIVPHLLRGQELKARYAFDDLWEDIYGSH
ncbi:MAG TPA: hypothetical protein VFE58_16800 [Tepidisphaeraceae bacterium]|jgi:hypothetical protein|nr:hypothetical protein [Tepidisphaeraceae bacterium]